MRTQGRQAALAEIAEVLTAVCETHKLPLAQTWIPGSVTCHAMNFIDGNDSNDSNRRFMNSYESSSSNSSSSSNNNDNGSGGRSRVCLRTADGPHYVNDPRVWGFRHACSEHFLEKGQGLPGKAYVSNQPSFEPDVKNYSKIEYPLGHYARLFGLGAAVAIRLRSIHTGSDDYVLEFFLPPTCVNSQEQQVVLNSLSITMQRVCRSLRTVSDKELQEEKGREFQFEENYQRNSGGSLRVSTVGTLASPDTGEKQEVEDPQISNLQSLNGAEIEESGELTEEGSLVFTSMRMGLDAATQKQRLDRRRGTSEKTIGLDIIQQHFTGSLKDAARSIGGEPLLLPELANLPLFISCEMDCLCKNGLNWTWVFSLVSYCLFLSLGLCCSVSNNTKEDLQTTWDLKVAISEDQQSESLIEEAPGSDRIGAWCRCAPSFNWCPV